MISSSQFYYFFSINNYLNIHVHITYIVYDLGALGLAWKIQAMGSLQYDN